MLATNIKYGYNCATAQTRVVFGQPKDPTSLNEARRRKPDSEFSLAFTLREQTSDPIHLLWFAGDSKDANLGIDYSNRREVSAVVRHLVGRALGNPRIPRTILEFLPEQLLACSRKGDSQCTTLLRPGRIESTYKLVTDTVGQTTAFTGCIPGLSPGVMKLSGNGYDLLVADKSVFTATFTEPQLDTSTRTEVFATHELTPHVYFELKSLSGNASHTAVGVPAFNNAQNYVDVNQDQSVL